jgi:hypothetical protein
LLRDNLWHLSRITGQLYTEFRRKFTLFSATRVNSKHFKPVSLTFRKAFNVLRKLTGS